MLTVPMTGLCCAKLATEESMPLDAMQELANDLAPPNQADRPVRGQRMRAGLRQAEDRVKNTARRAGGAVRNGMMPMRNPTINK
jgi:hypothetical protein